MNQQDLDVLCSRFMMEGGYVFFTSIFATINKIVDEETKTMGLSMDKHGCLKMHINPNWANSKIEQYMLDKKETRGRSAKALFPYILGELLHLISKHPFEAQSSMIVSKEVFNVAADLAVWQKRFFGGGEQSKHTELPSDVLTIDILKEKGLALDENRTVWYYYQELMKLLNEDPESEAAGAVSDEIQKGTSSDSHNGWGSFSENGRAKANSDIIDRIVQDAMQSAQSRGSMPAGLEQLIEPYIQRPPALDWRSELQNFSGNVISSESKATRKRESKRFSGAMGTKNDRRQNILVAIDTSGSMSDKAIEEVAAECHFLWEAGAQVDVCFFDAQVYVEQMIRYNGTPIDRVFGRGGTDFETVIDFINSDDNTTEYDGIMFFTDGYCPVPESTPKNGTKILWLITKDGINDTSDTWKEMREYNAGSQISKMNIQ